MDLAEFYTAYISCLNRRDWHVLGEFVARDIRHNDHSLGLDGYRQMLVDDYEAIPNLRFNIELLAVQPPLVASRLFFDCNPKGSFLGLAVDGRRIRFAENVFYRIQQGKIAEVWSVLDKAAIEAQLA
jgi:predicted ester cyclase